MIPKIIHYCWFSGDKKPALIRKCINSWKKHLPDYEIRCWDGNSFDFDSLAFTREAMSVKQYAPASDYVRLYALYKYGGIYLDSDVEVFKNFDIFLNDIFFSGFDESGGNLNIEAGIIGSVKGFPYIKQCMSHFEETPFIHPDGTYDNKIIIAPEIMSKPAIENGLKLIDKEQILPNGIHIYPRTVFANGDYIYNYNKINYTNLYAIHHNMGAWLNHKHGALWKFCHKNNLMGLYRSIEKTRLILKK